MTRWPILFGFLALPAVAQGVPEWPDHETCIGHDMRRFEMEFSRSRNAGPEPDLALLTQGGVLVCGSYFIGRCDLTDDRIACQDGLRQSQTALTVAVLDALPEPAQVEGGRSALTGNLYPQIWAIAHGTSAGDGCAGAGELYAAWCAAEAASRKLAEAVLLWRLARLLDAVPTAFEAGWIAEPPPFRPEPRPERG